MTEFSESIDDLFMAYEELHADDNRRKGEPVAVGVFYFEEKDANAKYEW